MPEETTPPLKGKRWHAWVWYVATFWTTPPVLIFKRCTVFPEIAQVLFRCDLIWVCFKCVRVHEGGFILLVVYVEEITWLIPLKGTVHPKNENSVIYSPCSKPERVFSSCWTPEKIFWRMLVTKQLIDFYRMWEKYNGSQWGLSTQLFDY